MNNQKNIVIKAENCKVGSAAGQVLIEDLNITVSAEETVVILGANGVGKTTFLRTILGLNKPLAGSLSVLGKFPSGGNKKIGYLPQLSNIESNINISGYGMVEAAVNGSKIGIPVLSAKQRYRVDLHIEQVGAKNYASQPFSELSGGQKQRLRLAQSLVNQPSLLLLDEPLTYLDQESQKKFIKLLFQMQLEHKVTVLLVSHDVSFFSSYQFKLFSLKHKRLHLS